MGIIFHLKLIHRGYILAAQVRGLWVIFISLLYLVLRLVRLSQLKDSAREASKTILRIRRELIISGQFYYALPRERPRGLPPAMFDSVAQCDFFMLADAANDDEDADSDILLPYLEIDRL